MAKVTVRFKAQFKLHTGILAGERPANHQEEFEDTPELRQFAKDNKHLVEILGKKRSSESSKSSRAGGE